MTHSAKLLVSVRSAAEAAAALEGGAHVIDVKEPLNGALGNVELWREAATLMMIAMLGLLAGRTWWRRTNGREPH